MHRARRPYTSPAVYVHRRPPHPTQGYGHMHRSTSQVYVHRLRRQYTSYTYASCFMCTYMHRVCIICTWRACVCVVLWPHDMNAHRLRPYPEPVKLRVTVRGLAYKNEVGFVFHSIVEKPVENSYWFGFGGLGVFHSSCHSFPQCCGKLRGWILVNQLD